MKNNKFSKPSWKNNAFWGKNVQKPSQKQQEIGKNKQNFRKAHKHEH